MPPEDIAQIYLDAAGDYRYRIRARNNEVIAQGEGYKRAEDIETLIGKHFPMEES